MRKQFVGGAKKKEVSAKLVDGNARASSGQEVLAQALRLFQFYAAHQGLESV